VPLLAEGAVTIMGMQDLQLVWFFILDVTVRFL